MRLKLNYIFLSLSLLALPGCKENEALVEPPIDIPDSEKTPIELSVGVVDGGFNSMTTRAVITDGTSKTKRAFTGATRLFFAMVAENSSSTEKKYGFNYGTAAAVSNPSDGSSSAISHPDDNWLYWDDAYARDSKVSIYSIAVANQERGGVILTDNGSIKIGSESNYEQKKNFTTTNPGTPTFKWSIGDNDNSHSDWQNENTFKWQDLVFSNNIAKHSDSNDKRLIFHQDTGDKYHKFDKGELIYYHALTKFTINIYCGDGFKHDGTDFKFTDAAGTNCSTPNNSFAMNGFYGKQGTFKIVEGEFNAFTDDNKQNYTSIYLENTNTTNDGKPYYTLEAYVLPGTDLTEDGVADKVKNAFSFYLDGNKYDVSMQQLYAAIRDYQDVNNVYVNKDNGSVKSTVLGDGKKLLAGNNYLFSFTVSKSKIKAMTAQVVDWETVASNMINPSNAKAKLQLEDRGSALDQEANIYRLAETTTNVSDEYPNTAGTVGYNWQTGDYGTANVYHKISDSPATWGLTDTWYWPNNITYYHFRAVSPTSLEKKTENYVDYVELSSGETYTDVLWGAPFKDINDSEKLSYSISKGFDGKGVDGSTETHQIYHGIGATEDQIKLLMFHMMSEVTIKIQSTGSDDEKVTLVDGEKKTSVKLDFIFGSGKISLGNGCVETSGSTGIQPITMSSTPNTWVYGAIPQELADDAMLVITTPDNNQYKIKLKDITVTASDVSTTNLENPYSKDTNGNYIINRWYPGYKYTYNINLKKKGIDKITATILQWETVEATPGDVQIK